jgi:queuine tRNA-ribosyltransferase
VQGGASAALRRRSARATAALGFEGHAHGGLGLGEEPARRHALLAEVHAELPEQAPRYLMGLGRPEDLVQAIERGVDLFDCVIPTRHARHGVLFTSGGELALRNARFRTDPEPPDPACDCATCAHHSRAYLRHLLQSQEALGARLASLHNLRFYLRLLERAREAIARGCLTGLRDELLEAARRRVA